MRFFGGRNNSADSAGLMVNALMELKTVATAIVSANCRYISPVIPGRNDAGMNTASNTRVVAITGPDTSLMALIAASFELKPLSMCVTVASTTTMASSTTTPMARTRPNKVSMLSEKPSKPMTAKVPMSETGIATAGISVARQSWRNTNKTRNTSADAWNSVTNTSLIDSSTKMVVS